MKNAPKKQTPIVIANWKMNPGTVGDAKKLFIAERKGVGAKRKVDVVVCPPTPFLSELNRLSPSKRIHLGAQDVYFEQSGAHTGEVSMSMLRSVGVTHVIVGHSERRKGGEDDEVVYKDARAVLTGNATAVVCVGERVREASGAHFSLVEFQLRAALSGAKKTELSRLIIAYEPIWAIGTGATATPEDVHEMKLFIQKVIADLFGRPALDKVRILYGGSVNKSNATELIEEGQVDGFLVGGASLKPTEFAEIVRAVQKVSS